MKAIQDESDFDAMVRAAKALAVVAAWSRLGLFDALAEGPRRIDALPAHPRGLATTVPVLKHLGLLVGDDERVALSPVARRLHETGGLPTERNFEWLRDLGRMAETIRDGGPVLDDAGEPKVTDGGVRRDDPERTAAFLDMLYERSATSAAATYEWLAPLLPKGASMLDVGGGHGRYARTFVEAGHRATLFDFPQVVEYARRRHGDRLTYLAGDFRNDDAEFGGPHDLVFLSNIVHGEPDAENRRLLKRLAACLKPGGWLVLKDMFIDEHGRDPESAVFFGLTMLYYTRAGESPTLSRAREWLEGAGLVDVHVTVLEGYQLVRARRPT